MQFPAHDFGLDHFASRPFNYTSLQLDINSVANWINQHHLSLNVSKCKCMTVTRLWQNSVNPPLMQVNGNPWRTWL